MIIIQIITFIIFINILLYRFIINKFNIKITNYKYRYLLSIISYIILTLLLKLYIIPNCTIKNCSYYITLYGIMLYLIYNLYYLYNNKDYTIKIAFIDIVMNLLLIYLTTIILYFV